MKIAIHNEPGEAPLGGSDVMAVVLAAELARKHEVEIYHHREKLVAGELAQHAGVDLSGVTFRRVPRHPSAWWETVRAIWPRVRRERRADLALTRPLDLYVTLNHLPPNFSAAKLSVLIVLFPFFEVSRRRTKSRLREAIRSMAYHAEVRSRLSNYHVKAAISEFSREWTRRRWLVDTSILYPPVDVSIGPGRKSNSILSVGRFAVPRHGHGKKQLEMVATFGQLRAACAAHWRFFCVGGCGSDADEVAYLEQVYATATANGAEIAANIKRAELNELYRSSKIFWHAAGIDVDENVEPQHVEHFGISTVEAMAAGCVPVVMNKGGQKEIVEHGISGFVWNSEREWQDYTLTLMKDNDLWERMSLAAQNRAQTFSREKLVERFVALVAPHLSARGLSL